MLQKKKQTRSLFYGTRSGVRPGFSLAEMILVVALTLFLLTVTVQGFVNSASQFSFANAAQKVEEMVRTARSLAISGKAQLDYTDFDKDGCFDDITRNTSTSCPFPTPEPQQPDYVTPAHYGVHLGKTTVGTVDTYTATLFADTHSTPANEGKFNHPGDTVSDFQAGGDVVIDQFVLPSAMTLIIPGSSGTSASVFFSPIFADLSADFTITSADPFFRYGVTQIAGDINRKRCFQIHVLAGISEPMKDMTSSLTSCAFP